jgi:hypothetical protein
VLEKAAPLILERPSLVGVEARHSLARGSRPQEDKPYLAELARPSCDHVLVDEHHVLHEYGFRKGGFHDSSAFTGFFYADVARHREAQDVARHPQTSHTIE